MIAHEAQLIIPFTVLRELDGLKNFKVSNSEKNSGVASLAQKANSFLYTHFHALNPALKGQTLSQTLNHDPNMTPDDCILDCCLYWQKNGSQNIILLSNGKIV